MNVEREQALRKWGLIVISWAIARRRTGAGEEGAGGLGLAGRGRFAAEASFDVEGTEEEGGRLRG